MTVKKQVCDLVGKDTSYSMTRFERDSLKKGSVVSGDTNTLERKLSVWNNGKQNHFATSRRVVNKLPPTINIERFHKVEDPFMCFMVIAVFVSLVLLSGGIAAVDVGESLWYLLMILLSPATLIVPGVPAWMYLNGGKERLTRKEWKELKSKRRKLSIPFDSDSVSEPMALAIVASRISADISSSRTWSSTKFNLERIKFNLDEEVDQILRNCELLNDMHTMRDDLKQDGWQGAGETLAEQVREHENLYSEALSSVMERVNALNEYKKRIVAMDLTVRDLEVALSISDKVVSLSPKMIQAHAAITGNRAAASLTRERAKEIDELRAKLEAELEFIQKHILAPNGHLMIEQS